MDKITILWADDEIDLLKPQLMFLERKVMKWSPLPMAMTPLMSVKKMMISTLFSWTKVCLASPAWETLAVIKGQKPHIPVVMITKNEAENVMEEAIGAQITDYLIKPVNPNQILLTLKKIVDKKSLVREKTSSDYQQEFRQIFMQINSGLDLKNGGCIPQNY
jgi:DNA-binding NtrC family response regulator